MGKYEQNGTSSLSVLPCLYDKEKYFLIIVEGEYISEERDLYRSLAGTCDSFHSVPKMMKSFLKEFPDCLCARPFFSGISRGSKKRNAIERIVRQHNRINFPDMK